MNLIIHLSVMGEQIYSGVMRFLCKPRSYFLLRCLFALNESAPSTGLYSKKCFKVTNALLPSLNATLFSTASPICTFSTSSMGSFKNYIISFSKHNYTCM